MTNFTSNPFLIIQDMLYRKNFSRKWNECFHCCGCNINLMLRCFILLKQKKRCWKKPTLRKNSGCRSWHRNTIKVYYERDFRMKIYSPSTLLSNSSSILTTLHEVGEAYISKLCLIVERKERKVYNGVENIFFFKYIISFVSREISCLTQLIFIENSSIGNRIAWFDRRITMGGGHSSLAQFFSTTKNDD